MFWWREEHLVRLGECEALSCAATVVWDVGGEAATGSGAARPALLLLAVCRDV